MEAQTRHVAAAHAPEPVAATPVPLRLLEKHAIIVTGETTDSVYVATLHEEMIAARVVARQRSWPTMLQDTIAKFHAGQTTGAEIRRVFGSEAQGVGASAPALRP